MTEAKRAIRFRYVNHRGEETVRTVRPLRVVECELEPYEGWHWYLVAHCLDQCSTRTFMLSRMRDIEEIEL